MIFVFRTFSYEMKYFSCIKQYSILNWLAQTMDMPANEAGCRLGLGKASWPKSRVMIEPREMCKKEHSISRKGFTVCRSINKFSELGILY